MTTQQLIAASALVVTLERICSSGVLSDKDEQAARLLVCRACNAFMMPTVAERTPGATQVELVAID